ncbi:MAG TPA: alpha/beta fold hydrolase [Bacteroidota bacterium]|jgi:3-oxoadipate enol-lactonase
MKFLTDGISIEYEVSGPRAGLPVVFVHGFPFDRRMWMPQLEALKEQYYAVTYDIRGFGASDAGDGQYSVEYFVDDLIGLLDHLKIPKAVVAGLSMGGYIALRAIERHPDRFRGVILADTRSEPDTNEGKVNRAAQARSVKRDGMKKFADAFLRAAFHPETPERLPEVVRGIRQVIEQTSPVAAAGTLLALAARTDTTPLLFTLTIPALILVGQNDTITPPAASSAMREKIPGAELHIISRAGHLSNLENAEEFNRHLLHFLAWLK